MTKHKVSIGIMVIKGGGSSECLSRVGDSGDNGDQQRLGKH